jgi:hypothetical protein
MALAVNQASRRGNFEMERWTFFQDTQGRWCWNCADGGIRVIRACGEPFATRSEAVADAMRHGYLKRPVRPFTEASAMLPGGVTRVR